MLAVFAVLLLSTVLLSASNLFMYIQKALLTRANNQLASHVLLFDLELQEHSLLYSRQEAHFTSTLRSWREGFEGPAKALGGNVSRATTSSKQVLQAGLQTLEEQFFLTKQKNLASQPILDILPSDYRSMDESLGTLKALYQNISQNKIFHAALPMRWPLQYGLGEFIEKQGEHLKFSVLPGTPVIAPSEGKVVSIRRNKAQPNLWDVHVIHEFGFATEFMQLGQVDVAQSDILKTGQVIGLSSEKLYYTVRLALQAGDAQRYAFLRY